MAQMMLLLFRSLFLRMTHGVLHFSPGGMVNVIEIIYFLTNPPFSLKKRKFYKHSLALSSITVAKRIDTIELKM